VQLRTSFVSYGPPGLASGSGAVGRRYFASMTSPLDVGFTIGGGDGNRTCTVSLGICSALAFHIA